MKPIALALCLAAAMAVPGASARNAEDYWCGTPRIHLMMWIAKVQVWARDDEGKLIHDKDGNLVWGGFGGETYEQYGIINHKLPPDHPKWVTVVPNRWIRLTKDNIYFRDQKCTVFTEKDQEKYGVGYFGPREDLRYPFQKGKIPEVITRFHKYECQVTEVVEDLSTGKPKTLTPKNDLVLIEVAKNPPTMKVSHIDEKGKVAERNKQYQNGSYVLLSTDSTDTRPNEMASPVFTLYGSRRVGSTIYRIVGKMTLDGEGPLYYGYYEEIYKDGSLDDTVAVVDLTSSRVEEEDHAVQGRSILTQRRAQIVRHSGHDRSRQIDVERAVLLVELERRAGYWSLFARCCVGGRKQQREHGNCNCCGKTGTPSDREKPRDDPT